MNKMSIDYKNESLCLVRFVKLPLHVMYLCKYLIIPTIKVAKAEVMTSRQLQREQMPEEKVNNEVCIFCGRV